MAKKKTATPRKSLKNRKPSLDLRAPAGARTDSDPVVPVEIQNEKHRMIRNGLSDVINGLNQIGIGQPGSGTQLSQTDTLWKNLRWYLISNLRQLLSQLYAEHGLIQTIVDVPVDDGLRGGIDIRSGQLSPDQLEALSAEIEREDIIESAIGGACKWNRLYGGAGVVLLTDQPADLPLDINALYDSPLEFKAVDMWELFYDKQNTEDQRVDLRDKTAEADKLQYGLDHYNYYGHRLDATRVDAMKGIVAPSFIRPRLRGWGLSEIETLVRSINQYLKSNNLSFEVLDEFKLDIFKINGLTNMLDTAEGTAAITNRLQLANMQKNYQNAIIMDKEDDFDHKQLSFSGLAETMIGIRMQIASDMRMPLTKLFGISAQGFNSGEDDIENYNAMVTSRVRGRCKYSILKMIRLKCMQMFGSIPTDIGFDFKPLRIMSSEQEETVKTSQHSRLMAMRTAGEITAKELRDACNKAKLLPIPLDTEMDDVEAELAAEPGNDPGNEDDTTETKEPNPKPPASATRAKDAPEAK